MICHKCKKEVTFTGRKVLRESLCNHCESYLRCCCNCFFYDEFAYNKCREPAAERVRDKERVNFCEFFQPNGAKPKANTRADEAREKLKELFSDKMESEDASKHTWTPFDDNRRAEEARKKLNELFKKKDGGEDQD